MIDTMLVNPHISDYICSLEPELPQELEHLYEDAVCRGVPVIRREAEGVLRFLLSMNRPKRILEIGTAVGFSALFMHYCKPDAKLLTIEKMPEKAEEARQNIAHFHAEHMISVVEGDAEEVLKQLCSTGEKYDFIFLDAAKAQYPVYLESILPMMEVGSVLVTDNIFQEGSLSESKFTVTRRNRTIHMRMREYVEELFQNKSLSSVILPVGDGMTASVKKDE